MNNRITVAKSWLARNDGLIQRQEATIERIRAENEKLRAALSDIYEITSRAGHLVDAVKRAAAAALKETGDE